MKKYIALLLSLCLLTSICCLTSFSADLSDYSAPTAGVASAFCDCLPENAEYNQVITFTVATDTNASKIKICRADGQLYAFANILAGFENYSDNAGVRTWSIQKRVEIPAPVNLKIYAGNCAFEYSSVTADILSGNIPEPEGLWDKSAAEIVSMINAGWNLGNTLDSWGEWIDLYTDRTPERYETAWGNPVTSKAMIDGVKAGGFDLIRIPVTWAQHIDPDTYRIDPVWMARVREVVDYAIDENTFVILNTHHEDNWINVDGSMSVETMSAELTAVWTQIANEFADYDQHLIFEVMNETRDIGSDDEWSGNAASYERVNQLGAAALAAIRATGGKNATDRCVMLPTYAASSSPAPMNALTIPSGDSHVIVSIHAYTPYNFAVDHESPYNLSIQSQLDTLFNNISAMQAAKNNVPVIIGEFGCYVKTDGTSRNSWASYYLSKARSLGYPCVVWDNGGNNEYQIFNRNTLTWDDPAYVSILTGNN